jgi:hypothetical protein
LFGKVMEKERGEEGFVEFDDLSRPV